MIGIGFDPGLNVTGAALVRCRPGARPYRLEAVAQSQNGFESEGRRLVELEDWAQWLVDDWLDGWAGAPAVFGVEAFEVQGKTRHAVGRFLRACRPTLRAQAALEIGVYRAAGGSCLSVTSGGWHRALRVPASRTGRRADIKRNAKRWLTAICENSAIAETDHMVDAAFVAIHEINRARPEMWR